MNKKREELNERCQEEILAEGERRFPTESYRQLRAAGATHEEAMQMLGFDPESGPTGL